MGDSDQSAPAFAYLVSRYPDVTHTFIAEEVRALRSAGAGVATFSIRRTGDADVLSEADRAEFAKTRSLLPVAPLSLVAAHVVAFARGPSAYVATLRDALAMRTPGARAGLWQVFYFAEAMVLWSHLRRGGPRHLHVHFPNVASDVAMLVSRFGNRARGSGRESWAWTMTLHGPTEFNDVAGHKIALKVAEASAVICTSDYVRSQVLAITAPRQWQKVHVVRCGVDTARFAPSPHRRHDTGPLRILNVAAMSPRKGHRILIEAVAELCRRGNDVVLTLVGQGPERTALEALAGELGIERRVKFRGALGHDAVRECYGDHDVFCLPSFAEGVPLVLIEAMASGVPVVGTTIAGVPELIRDGDTGRLVPPGRADLLADTLAELAADSSLRHALAGRALSWVRREYDLPTIVPELLRALVAGHAADSAGSR